MILVGALLIANAGAACAQGAAAAARILTVVGDVRITGRDGAQRAAQRAAEYYEGESIVTGAGALVQLRMSDGALMSVRAETEIKLDSFAYRDNDDRNANFFLSVLKGGLRTISGMIAKQNREHYRIVTETATIGIRGTDFELVHVPQRAASQEAPAGTYNRVYDGETSMQNKLGVTLLIARDQTGFAELRGTTPPVHVAPPAAIFGRATPLPAAAPPPTRPDDGKADKTQPVEPGARPPGTGMRGSPARDSTPLINPLESSPRRSFTPIESPAMGTSPLLAPVQTAPTVRPSTVGTPILTAPTLPASPVLTPIQTAPTTTISPVLTPIQTAPTMTISPVLTPIQTTPTTPISPVLTPIQTAPIRSTPVIKAPITPITVPLAPAK
jgi:hypothetical protein